MTPKKTLESRTLRILILSGVFFLSGLVFFAVRMTEKEEVNPSRQFSPDASPSIEDRVRLVPSLAKYPEPSVFHQFSYERGDTLVVEGVCTDAYYTIMIFDAEVDYRASPNSARFNTAYPCEGEVFVKHVPIDTLFLEEGGRYYVIKAHQAETGEWYDPY